MAAAQEEFVRAVAHDLRAPLRHVTSYGALVCELLAELPGGAAQSPGVQEALGFLGTMDQSARRMGLMIDGLQALAQVGRAPLRCGPVALTAALAQARTALAAAEAGRTVHWKLATELPVLHADAGLLHALLVQVLGNALKFTRDRAEVHIHVTAEPTAEGRVAVSVRDNGVGFDPARAGALFGVFERLHRETEFEGVGAGLAQCRAIALRHGANIQALGRPGQGCSVRLDWPLHPSV
jgi:light-regulated signal transduction histidine kinase (bacteriophytochrome)